ncbi:autotransporter outer membrane beta-barrel domain-containing protein [Variovorax sp. J22P168]|uniref:autotransporter outer membrane beta-barrel domain-containing protein n=1 Tax=Variovorax jilinensis TaxID=3053513 RepID=UPI002576E5D2|nr:autotransporter outer membrane beta-barrel domain-containing protein [Variovorax sp. J22P168]MDM0011850.1 autotransporter outer membrane beta-barrel domain-containing protein [Variovorax sp. J22P168]
MNRVFSVVWNSSLQVWAVASELAGKGRQSGTLSRGVSGHPVRLAALHIAMAAGLAGFGGAAQAACTTSGAVITCAADSVQTTIVGDGPAMPAGTLVNVLPNAILNTGDNTAISIGDGSTIAIGNDALVQNTVTSTTGGNFGTGANTIEMGSNNTVTIGAGAQVRSEGTAFNAEAINMVGTGNTLTNYGTIFSNAGGAAFWLEQPDGKNTIINEVGGTIQYASGASILGMSGAMATVDFTNKGTITGSLTFTDGDDRLRIDTGSSISGTIDGGGGSNTLELNGAGTDTFVKPFSNFQSLIKAGTGTWTFQDSLQASGITATTVQSGTLILGADESGYSSTGTMTVAPDGILQTSGAFAPKVITDNGLVRFEQTANGSYDGLLSGSGGIEKTGAATLTLLTDQAITGTTTISAGTLQLGAGGTAGMVTGPIVNNAALAIDRSDTVTFASPITGSGSVTQQGAGTTIFTADNTYAGSTTISAGTLQLGAGGTTGGVTGPILNNAALVIDRSNAITLAGPITGSGSVTQQGAGTTTFTADNSYGGGTTISAGTLQLGAGGTTGSVTGPILNNAALVIDRSNALTLAAPITGSGSVTQQGAGTTTFTADNSYVGTTTIAAGVLQLGAGGTTGSVTGPILNNASLVIDRSNALTLAAPITGSGSVTQQGAGTTTFTADNTYAGGTTISAGTLQLGAGGTSGAIVGDVLNNGTLRIDRSNALQLDGAISGTGALVQAGSGSTVLTGANSYLGPTTVAAGALRAGAANAFSASSAHAVAAGATLDTGGFNQTVASLSNAGTVNLLSGAAGSTLTVNGAYVGNNGVLNLGTVLAGSSSLSDRLVLNGSAASATGNTTVRITNLGGLGALTTGNGIEVVTAQNGATTTAQTTRNAFALANGHVDAGAFEYRLYAADASGAGENWYLRSTTTVPPVDPVPPVNPVDPTKPVDPGAVPVPTYRLEVPLFAALPAQLRQTDLSMLGNLHRRVGDQTAPAASASGEGVRQAWARAVYSDLDIRQKGLANARSDGHVSGLQAGTDLLASGNWRAGIYVGMLDGNADVSGNARGLIGTVGSNDIDARYVGAYATWMGADGMYADSVLQGGRHDYTVRPLGNPSIDGKATSLTASIEIGKAFPLAENWSIEPQAQLIRQSSRFDNVLIGGAIVGQDADGGWIGRLGVRVKGDLATAAGRLQPYARLNVYNGGSGTDIATFVGPAGSTAIASATGYTSTELAAGMTLKLTPVATLYGEVGQLYSNGGDARVKSSVQGSIGMRLSW